MSGPNPHRRILTVAFVLAASACTSTPPKPRSIGERVSAAVEATVRSSDAEEKAFHELANSGPEAVPYLVGHLGDDRPVAKAWITLPNRSANAFEAYRHYGPATVHDALAAILNHITYKSFVFVYNGSTPQQRADNRKRWVAWCREVYPAKRRFVPEETSASNRSVEQLRIALSAPATRT